ncbi:hypothetical protein DVA86_13005 [Streptomyces armeniacus]|uniref:DUF4097 domain-containing protein n=1 Tax=Streptomyces armeniacus TaxID=83291 RepID=A0A345XP70_9ACTN|nr:DUF4097 family beta strand repeat-containing protein [Streptomyces armeniacus]AXK33436.1 hypothetical protein DVA86_13005 [Streptomyces armeniacus]
MTKTTAGAALALALIAVAATLSGCSMEQVSDGKAKHKSFALTGRQLTVVTGDSRLELVPVDREADAAGTRQLDVTRWFKASKLNGKVGADWELEGGDTLRLKVTCKGLMVDCSARHRVEVPRDVAVDVRSQDGRVSASGFSTPLSIRTADGDVEVRGAGADLKLRTADGDIRAEKLRSRSVSARSQDGSLTLGFREPPTSVRTESQDGSTTVTAPRTPYRIRTDTADGSVDVSLPRRKSSPRSIEATAQDGSITLRGS